MFKTENNAASVEKALSSLGLRFAWEEEELFILDSEKITGEDLHVRAVLRENALQLSVYLFEQPSPEQTGVLFWQEWQRRGEASFCMVDEEDGETKVLLVVRLPLYQINKKELPALIKAGLLSLAKSYTKRKDLFEDVAREEL